METFAVLLLLVFVPFGWFIVRALRYTSETVGENSPLYRERTYQLSASQYFLGFTKLMLAFLFVQMIGLSEIMVRESIRQRSLLIGLLILLFLGFAGYIVYFFYIDWQYWTITRDVRLTLNPFRPSIHVDSLEQTATLTPDNLARIELHIRESDNPRDILSDYGYYLFYGTDGSVIRINRLFFLHIHEFLERHFSQIPESIVWHKLPPIKPMSTFSD